MKKLLERYLEAKKLFEETTKVVEGNLDADFRKAAIEIAEEHQRIAEDQFRAAITQHGLPSVEAAPPLTHEHLYANRTLMLGWLQERADHQQRAQFFRYVRSGEVLRAYPTAKDRGGAIAAPLPRETNPMRGM